MSEQVNDKTFVRKCCPPPQYLTNLLADEPYQAIKLTKNNKRNVESHQLKSVSSLDQSSKRSLTAHIDAMTAGDRSRCGHPDGSIESKKNVEIQIQQNESVNRFNDNR